jgi:hypothetical protein
MFAVCYELFSRVKTPMKFFNHFSRLGRIAAFAVLVVAGFGMQANAAVILGNLPAANDDQAALMHPGRIKAFAFTMGADAYKLDSVVLRLSLYSFGTPLIQILDDDGGSNPGSTVLASFTKPGSQGVVLATYTFTPTSSLILNGSTKYWLYVSASEGAYYVHAASPSIAPAGVATLTGNRFSDDFGSNFTDQGTYVDSFQINGTLQTPPVVPEPSTMAVFGIGTLVAGVARARRRRKQQA